MILLLFYILVLLAGRQVGSSGGQGSKRMLMDASAALSCSWFQRTLESQRQRQEQGFFSSFLVKIDTFAEVRVIFGASEGGMCSILISCWWF